MARIKRSTRYFIDAQGNEVDRMEQATGAGYTLVDGERTVRSWEAQYAPVIAACEAANVDWHDCVFHAIFGRHTKCGNVANTVLNDKDSPGTPDEAAEAVTEHLDNCALGIWREAAEGVARGPKYDPALAGRAIYEAAKAEGFDVSRLDPTTLAERYATDKAFAAKMRGRAPFQVAYHRLAAESGKAAAGVGDLLA
jgi:hypothetical protein